VANLIRLLDLPDAVQSALKKGAISPGHARALLPLGDEHEQVQFCQRIQAEGLSVRAIEDLVQETIHHGDADAPPVIRADGPHTVPAPKSRRTRPEQLVSLEKEFRAALGTKVQIRQSAKGSGKIIVHFTNAEEFERLRDYLSGTDEGRMAG